MVLKKIRVRCLWIFFGEVGWSWGTDSFIFICIYYVKIRLGPGDFVLFPAKRRRLLFKYIQQTRSFTCRILFGELAVEAVKRHHFRHHPSFKKHIFFIYSP